MSTAGHRRCDTVCGRRRRGDRGASMTPPPDSPAPCWPLAPRRPRAHRARWLEAPARAPALRSPRSARSRCRPAGTCSAPSARCCACSSPVRCCGPRVLRRRTFAFILLGARTSTAYAPASAPARSSAAPLPPRTGRSSAQPFPWPARSPSPAIRRPRPCRDPAADPASPRRAHPAQRRRSRRPHRPDRRTTTHLVIAFLPPDPTTPTANGPHPSQRSVDAINGSLTNRAIARAPAPTPRTVASLPAPPAACTATPTK